MRRAVLVLALLACLPLPAGAAKPDGPVDAIGMLDFTRGARFKVGDWVRYRTFGRSAQGFLTDYTVTLLIAGEENWWGEECFWVETWASYSGQDPEVTGSLLSYSVFEDSLPRIHFQRYIRKYFNGFDGDGNPLQSLFLRSPAEFLTRQKIEYEPFLKRDTLGVEPVEVPKGRFMGLRERQNFHEAVTKQDGDSTVYFELIEDHDYWYSAEVPITSLVRVDQENRQRRRVWMVGESADAPLRIVEHTTGGTELLDFGHGLKSRLLPERFQRSLSEQNMVPASRTPGAPRRPPARRG